MTLLRKHKIDLLLKKAYESGKVLCGVSAGAICWCDYGNSDSRRFTSGSDQFIKVKGLGFINVLMCPHFNKENNRQKDLPRMMKLTHKIPAIALDDGAALEIVDNEFRIITSIQDAKARKCFWKNGEYISKILEQNVYENIEKLYKKE